MKTKNLLTSFLVLLAMTLPITVTNAQSPATPENIGTAFTYQGHLKRDGAPVNGTCDVAFRLFDAASAGNQIGSVVTKTLQITNGLFTTQLNGNNEFGATAFNGNARWLEIRVSNTCPASGAFTTLTPRQAITPAPYAMYSSGNWGLQGNAGTSPGSNFFGTTDNQPLVFKTNNAEVMRLDSTGKLGIGTTSPSEKLTVVNGTIRSESTAFLSEGFEGVTFPPAGWTTGGTSLSSWVRATDQAYQGSASAAITMLDNYVTAYLDFDYTLPDQRQHPIFLEG